MKTNREVLDAILYCYFSDETEESILTYDMFQNIVEKFKEAVLEKHKIDIPIQYDPPSLVDAVNNQMMSYYTIDSVTYSIELCDHNELIVNPPDLFYEHENSSINLFSVGYDVCVSFKPRKQFSSKDVEFTVKVKMREDWVPVFYSMLKKMEKLGKIGSSRDVCIRADGDGSFRPTFEFPEKYCVEVLPWKKDGRMFRYDWY